MLTGFLKSIACVGKGNFREFTDRFFDQFAEKGDCRVSEFCGRLGVHLVTHKSTEGPRAFWMEFKSKNLYVIAHLSDMCPCWREIAVWATLFSILANHEAFPTPLSADSERRFGQAFARRMFMRRRKSPGSEIAMCVRSREALLIPNR
jgi:hypothetical protein